MEKWSTEEVSDFLQENSFDDEVVEIFRRNKVSGRVLRLLSCEDMQQLGIAAFGDRKYLSYLITNSKEGSSAPLTPNRTSSTSSQQNDMVSPSTDEDYTSDNYQYQPDMNDIQQEVILDMDGRAEDSSMNEELESIEDEPTVRTTKTSKVVLLSNVPERASGWENNFVIPMQYSNSTMAALQTKVITDRARHEITQEVCSRMLNHCTYPTSKQFEVVATKLVHKLPQLRDTYFTGHESWTKAFKRRFINVRRPLKRELDCSEIESPPVKKTKMKATARQYNLPKKADNFTYKWHITSMKSKTISDLQSRNTISSQMQMTTANRMEWIKTSKPTSKMVLDEFPHLQDYQILEDQFRMITSLGDPQQDTVGVEWGIWSRRVEKYAEVLKKPSMMNILRQLRAEVSAENKFPLLLRLLSKVMDKTNKDADSYVINYLKSDTQPKDAIADIGISSPYIIYTGTDELHPDQFLVISECQTLFDTTSFAKAAVGLIAWYYVMDMAYPTKARNTYSFIETILFKLPTTVSFTGSALQAVSAMEQLQL